MRRIFVALALTLTLTTPAPAQDWPSRPMTMVVAYAAGGPVDTIARIFGQRLSEVLGQQLLSHDGVDGLGELVGLGLPHREGGGTERKRAQHKNRPDPQRARCPADSSGDPGPEPVLGGH